MKIKRLLFLAMMLALLCLPSMRTARADAGGACLGQWSECRSQCNEAWPYSTGYRAVCYGDCDYQRDRCL